MAYGILVREVMTHHPVVIDVNKSVLDAVKKMLKSGVGSVIVIDKEKVVRGIFTEKDVIARVVAKKKDPEKTKIKQVMTKKPVVINQWLDLEEVAEIMNKKNVRRLPVVEKGKLIGLITEKDMLKVEPQIIDVLKEKMRIREPELKPILRGKRREAGICEVCSNYSDHLEYYNGMWVCEACLEEMEG